MIVGVHWLIWRIIQVDDDILVDIQEKRAQIGSLGTAHFYFFPGTNCNFKLSSYFLNKRISNNAPSEKFSQ